VDVTYAINGFLPMNMVSLLPEVSLGLEDCVFSVVSLGAEDCVFSVDIAFNHVGII
jgi:hypothetical protein